MAPTTASAKSVPVTGHSQGCLTSVCLQVAAQILLTSLNWHNYMADSESFYPEMLIFTSSGRPGPMPRLVATW